MKINAKLVNAIYYYDKPNVYRPNCKELDTNMFNCPRCKKKLSIPRQTASKPVFTCPGCGFKIPFEQVLHTRDRVEEYMAEQKKKIADDVVKESVFLKESDPLEKKKAKSRGHAKGDLSMALREQGFFDDPVGSGLLGSHLRDKVKHETLEEERKPLQKGNPIDVLDLFESQQKSKV